MTVDEAKKVLLAANHNSNERNALYVLLEAIDYKDLPDEEWRDVVGYEGLYQVSNCGRVRSFQKGKMRVLKSGVSRFGYLRVVLSKDSKKKNRPVHILVAQAFIPNPENKPQVHHIDGNKNNNHVSNLQWATSAENIRYAFEDGLRKSGSKHCRAKFTAEQVIEIRRDCVPGDPERGFKAFARKLNVTPKIVQNAFFGISYQDVEMSATEVLPYNQPLPRPDNYPEVRDLWKDGKISARTAGKLSGTSHQRFLKWARSDEG